MAFFRDLQRYIMCQPLECLIKALKFDKCRTFLLSGVLNCKYDSYLGLNLTFHQPALSFHSNNVLFTARFFAKEQSSYVEPKKVNEILDSLSVVIRLLVCNVFEFYKIRPQPPTKLYAFKNPISCYKIHTDFNYSAYIPEIL